MTETLGQVIREKRKEKGISLRELARRIDISHPYLSQLENGRNDSPSPLIIYSLSNELDISFTYLIYLSNTDSGIDKKLLEVVLPFMKEVKPSNLFAWDTFEEFKKSITSNVSGDKNNPGKELVTDEELKEVYDYLVTIKRIESGLTARSTFIEEKDIDNDYSYKNYESRSKENYINGIPTPIFLNDNNEGNFYFFKEGTEIPEETQAKLRLMIKTIMD